MDEAALTAPMPESHPIQDHHCRSHAVECALKLVAGLAGAMGLWWVAWVALGGNVSAGSWVWHLSMPTAILVLIGLMVFREARFWRSPGRKLEQLLPEIRAGSRPIEELGEVGGGLAKIVPLVQELLRDLRQQRQAIARLEEEIKQRVAGRTNALERQLGSLQAQATRDPLTGLYNRRMLDACLPKMVEGCRAAASELSVLAVDVDNFKQLNDTLGHAAGDALLRSIAQVLRSGVRECDAAIRCGGDEFVLLLPGCPSHVAEQLAARLTALVSTLGKTLKTPNPAGLSVGFASLRQLPPSSTSTSEEAASALLEAADKSLYTVKATRKAGRPPGRSKVA